MKIVKRLDRCDASRGCVLSVGIFDGFHQGHQKIIATAVSIARERNLAACAMTFHPHPRRVLLNIRQDLITSIDHRMLLLERAGVETTLLVEFSPEFASATAERFVVDLAQGTLGARVLVLGQDAHLGAGRSGNVDNVAKIASAAGIEVVIVDPVIVGDGPVSSTRVREAILAGDLPLAESLLGRRVSVFGTVVRGQGIGRQLGFPTANLDVHREVRPPFGVYATWAWCGPDRIPSVTNVGFRPTFDERSKTNGQGLRQDRLVEAHLLAAPESEIYGTQIELEFVEKLRDERRFGTDAELAAQIARDVERAHKALESDARR